MSDRTYQGELDGRAIYANRPAADVSEAAEMLVRALLRRYGGEDGLREAIRAGTTGGGDA